MLGLIICSGFTFALDLDQGEIKVGTGFGYYNITKVWDIDGDSTDLPSSFDGGIIVTPFGVAYGISDSLDVSLTVVHMSFSDDMGGDSGIAQPLIGVKYMSAMDLGASLDVWLPLGSEDIVGTDPLTELDIAVLYEPRFDSIDLDAGISYNLTFEDEFDEKQDAITISAKPTYKAMEGLGVSLGMDYLITMDEKVDGTSVDDTGSSLFTVTPGANYDINEMVNLALDIPLDVTGKNTWGGWAIELGLTLSF